MSRASLNATRLECERLVVSNKDCRTEGVLYWDKNVIGSIAMPLDHYRCVTGSQNIPWNKLRKFPWIVYDSIRSIMFLVS